MRLIKTSEIALALHEVKPNQIAVAYVGKDWKTFVDSAFLREIIVSPTLGSNPYAIKELAEEPRGWKNVHFLDKLHTKMYIGIHKAAVGSFNLSRNGISATGLEELGIVTNDQPMIEELRNEFERLRKLAQNNYKTKKCKTERLAVLLTLTKRAASERLISTIESDEVTQLENYKPISENDFLVAWYLEESIDIDYDRLSSENPDINEENYSDVVENSCNFFEKDEILVDTWILMWKARSNGLPMEKLNAYWLYAHRIAKKTVKNNNYTTLVIQMKDKNPHWTEPFDLSKNGVQAALRKVLLSPEFSEFRGNSLNPWSFKPSKSKILQFINKAKEFLQTAK